MKDLRLCLKNGKDQTSGFEYIREAGNETAVSNGEGLGAIKCKFHLPHKFVQSLFYIQQPLTQKQNSQEGIIRINIVFYCMSYRFCASIMVFILPFELFLFVSNLFRCPLLPIENKMWDIQQFINDHSLQQLQVPEVGHSKRRNCDSLIQKYGLYMCHQCFCQYAKDTGFIKLD